MPVYRILFLILLIISTHAASGNEDRSVHLVRFTEPSLGRYDGPDQHEMRRPRRGHVPRRGQVPHHGHHKLDARLPVSRAYLDALDALQAGRLAAIESSIGRSPDVVFRYRAVLNGLAVRLTAAEAGRVATLPGVKSVARDEHLPLSTDAGPAWIGASALWDGSASPALPATKGEGVVVGIIDSGINMDHPSFSDAPPDGHVYANPLGAGNFLGWCDPAHPDHDPAYVCNDKLIGGWDFVEAVSSETDGPEDDFFHGSHVASIAAGNDLDWPAVAGVAPHAHLVAYDVCFTMGFGVAVCPVSAITAAIDQAVLDGVDVLNLSIGGGTDPWNDVDAALLDAVAAGIFVAASAGNDGPAAGTVGHRGPWVTTVAAGTHHRVANENRLTGLSGGATLPPGDLVGQSLTPAHGPASIVAAGDCTNPFAPGTFPPGSIAVCDAPSRGRRFSYCENVKTGGAGGCVLANVAGGTALVTGDFHAVPAIHVDDVSGDALRSWLTSGTGHQATITAAVLVTDPLAADLMEAFSSRGPNPSFDVLKPDLSAPGSVILGAVSTGLLFGFTGDEFLTVSGTSMASPHVAGAAALLVALHPAWSPAEVRSALVTTAVSPLLEEDGLTPTDPFDAGGGRPDLDRAARAGLLLDENAASYAAADPALGGAPGALNLPSFTAGECDAGCAFSRTVKTARIVATSWTTSSSTGPGTTLSVTPPRFSLTKTEPTQTLEVTVTLDTDFPFGSWAFAEVVLVSGDPEVPATRLPVAVFANGLEIMSDGFESGDTSLWSRVLP